MPDDLCLRNVLDPDGPSHWEHPQCSFFLSARCAFKFGKPTARNLVAVAIFLRSLALVDFSSSCRTSLQSASSFASQIRVPLYHVNLPRNWRLDLIVDFVAFRFFLRFFILAIASFVSIFVLRGRCRPLRRSHRPFSRSRHFHQSEKLSFSISIPSDLELRPFRSRAFGLCWLGWFAWEIVSDLIVLSC